MGGVGRDLGPRCQGLFLFDVYLRDMARHIKFSVNI